MTRRERFRTTMEHESPDRVPIDLGATSLTGMSSGCQQRLIDELGFEREEDSETVGVDERVLSWAGTDFRSVGGIVPLKGKLARWISPEEYVDAWGVRRRKAGQYWDIVESPLRNAERADLDSFPWPDTIVEDRVLRSLQERARRLQRESDFVVIGEHPVLGILELGCWMCGYDDFLARFLVDPDFVLAFFDRYLSIQISVIDQYYAAIGDSLDVTTSGDDFGMQSGPLLSPEMFARFIAPYFSERIRRTKSLSSCYFWHHTCGSVVPLLDQIIDCGVDILNPIQTSASGMVPAELKQRFGDRLVFWGGLDVQDFLRTSSPEAVRAGVTELIDTLGRDGGYVLAPAHNIQDDVPPQNIVAIVEAVNGAQ